MASTNLKTTMNLDGVARLIRRQTLLALRQRKVNYIYTLLSILIIRGTIKLTPTNAFFGDTNSTKNGNKEIC